MRWLIGCSKRYLRWRTWTLLYGWAARDWSKPVCILSQAAESEALNPNSPSHIPATSLYPSSLHSVSLLPLLPDCAYSSRNYRRDTRHPDTASLARAADSDVVAVMASHLEKEQARVPLPRGVKEFVPGLELVVVFVVVEVEGGTILYIGYASWSRNLESLESRQSLLRHTLPSLP